MNITEVFYNARLIKLQKGEIEKENQLKTDAENAYNWGEWLVDAFNQNTHNDNSAKLQIKSERRGDGELRIFADDGDPLDGYTIKGFGSSFRLLVGYCKFCAGKLWTKPLHRLIEILDYDQTDADYTFHECNKDIAAIHKQIDEDAEEDEHAYLWDFDDLAMVLDEALEAAEQAHETGHVDIAKYEYLRAQTCAQAIIALKVSS